MMALITSGLSNIKERWWGRAVASGGAGLDLGASPGSKDPQCATSRVIILSPLLMIFEQWQLARGWTQALRGGGGAAAAASTDRVLAIDKGIVARRVSAAHSPCVKYGLHPRMWALNTSVSGCDEGDGPRRGELRRAGLHNTGGGCCDGRPRALQVRVALARGGV